MKKTRKILSLILGLLIIAAAAAGCGKKEELPAGPAEPAAVETPEAPPAEPAAPVESEKPAEPEQTPAEEKGVLLMATTTSTDDTGLLDYLKPIFLADTGWDLQWDAVGTGEALKMGENGDVAVVLVHAKASEEEFVAGGYGVERFPVMYNDFIVAGPAQPIAHTDNIEAVFSRIIKEQLPFVSRGDDSGTDKKGSVSL